MDCIKTTILSVLLSVSPLATTRALPQEQLQPPLLPPEERQVSQKEASGAYSEVMAIAEIAKEVMESYESKFTIIGFILAGFGILFAFVGWKRLDTIKDLVLLDVRKTTDPLTQELQKEKAEHKTMGEQHERLIAELNTMKEDLKQQKEQAQKNIKSLILLNLAYGYMQRAQGDHTMLRLRRAKKTLERVLNETPTEQRIIGQAYTAYSHVIRRLEKDDKVGKAKALEMLKEAMAKGSMAVGMCFNAACYTEDDDEAYRYLEQAIREDPSILIEAMLDSDLKERVTKFYPQSIE